MVLGNAAQLRQMLVNVTSNAVDALNDSGGKGRISMTTENTPAGGEDRSRDSDQPSGHHVLIHVTDTGPGMDQSIQNHLFEPFFTTKEVGSGTGLGLATAHGIVLAHQGRISCASVKGQGTTFTLAFPVCEEEPQTGEDPGGIADHEPEPFSGEGRVQRILFVDDEDVVLEVIQEWLEEIGFEVVTCQSGEEALQSFSSEKENFDLVILDLGMPGLGGEGTLKAMLEIDPQAKILVASGYQRHPISEDPQRFGAAGFLGKPFRFEALHASILNCLQ
jgi:CheY-like chemotaxis protein